MKFMSKDNFLAKTQLPFQYPNSMLAAMFNAESERPPAEKDVNGNFFLDCNPRAFEYILDFLRRGKLPEDIVGCGIDQVEWEADYFGLQEILKIIGERKKAKKAADEEKRAEEERKRAEEEARKTEREMEEKMKLLRLRS